MPEGRKGQAHMTNKQAKNNNLIKKPNKKGRPKGAPNKTTALLKEAILKAADRAGGKAGLVGYLKEQAKKNPGPFIALLGKVLPLQLTNDGDDTLKVTLIERVIIKAKD